MRIAVAITTLVALTVTARADAPTAESLYNAGQAAYDAGDFAVAVARWEESYALSKEPALLFNIAQAKRLSGDCPGAIATYRRFIEADPTADQRSLAADLVRELAAACELPKPAPQPVPTSIVVERRNKHDDRTLKITGIATGGAGAVAIAIGVGLGIHARSLGDAVTSACRTSCDWSAWRAKDAAGRRDSTAGIVLDTAGAVGIVGGAILYYVGMRRGPVLVPREGGAIAMWSGSW